MLETIIYGYLFVALLITLYLNYAVWFQDLTPEHKAQLLSNGVPVLVLSVVRRSLESLLWGIDLSVKLILAYRDYKNNKNSEGK